MVSGIGGSTVTGVGEGALDTLTQPLTNAPTHNKTAVLTIMQSMNEKKFARQYTNTITTDRLCPARQ
jgi:hypothetical protein